MPGEKYLWYVPNTDHRLNQNAFAGAAAFIVAQEIGAVLPEISWTFEGAGKNTLRVNTDTTPFEVKLWQATRTDSIDFRQETNAPPYTSTVLSDQGGGEYVGTVPIPTTGGTAFFVELTYFINGQILRFTTQVSIAEPPPPRLVGVNPGVNPNATPDFLLSGANPLAFAPQDLTFRFNSQQQLASDLSGIQIFNSGGDDTFGDGNEILLIPDSIGIEPDGYTVVATFDQPLPEERYRIVITGDDDLPNNVIGLRNFNGDPFEAGDGRSTEEIDFDVSVIYDFGDAPDTYGTLLANGARHTVQPWQLPRLGPNVDTELNGQPTGADDSTGVDDEDGIPIGTFNDDGKSYTVFMIPGADPTDVEPDEVMGLLNPDDPAVANMSVQVFGDGFLDVWVDFNGNGTFDSSEHVVDGRAVSGDPDTGTFQTVNIATPNDAAEGMSWMRVRIGEAPSSLPGGLAIGGEVEDYPVEVIRFTDVPPGENEPPSFDIQLPLDAGQPTLEILERDNSLGKVIEDFVVNVAPGDPTSLDELATQTTTVSITEFDVPAGLMTAPPVLTGDGQLTVFPAPNAVGSAIYDLTVTDDHPSNPLATTKRFVIQVRPVNDQVAIDSSVIFSSGVNPDDPAQSYFVEADGTIRYAIREDNTQIDGTIEPFFIPLVAGTGPDSYPIGLFDVLTVGPDNESDGTLGGSQILSLITPADENGDRIIDFTDFADQQLTDNNVIDESPQVSGSNIVWQSGMNSFPFYREIMFFDGTTTTQVTDNDFTDRDPQISGNNLTWWGESGTSANDREIFFWDGSFRDGLPMITQVSDDSIWDADPQISGSTVVWQHRASSGFEIYKWDGDSPLVGPVNVSENTFTDSSPQIDGSNIVYRTSGSGLFAISRNIGGTNEFVAAGQTNLETPQVEGDRVVWRQIENSPSGLKSDILYFDGTDTVRLTDNGFHDFFPQISGQNVVWVENRPGGAQIYLYDGVTKETQQISNNANYANHPQIDGNIVVWQGNDGNFDEIFAWDGTSVTQLTDNNYNDQMPQISGNHVVWQALSKGSGDGIEIFHAELTLGYAATDQGGTLTPVYEGGELIGWNYIPPADFNSNLGFDSFTYEVTDDGKTYDLDTGELLDDPQRRMNQVRFVLSPVNDAPVFDLPIDPIIVEEDHGLVSLPGFATNIDGGPIGTATDENDPPTSQALNFTINPLDFDVADMPLFFSAEPVLDAQTGELTFQTAADVFGSYQFEVLLTDDGADDPSGGDVNQSAPQLLTIHVLAKNDSPVIRPNTPAIEYTLNEDGTVEIEIDDLLNVFDAGPLTMFGDESANVTPGGNQTVSLADPAPTTTAEGGTLQLLTTGGPPRLLYTPRVSFNGTDSFVYTVADDGVTVSLDELPFVDPLTATNTVTLNVNSINNPPVFDIDAPLVGGVATLSVLEPEGSDAIAIDDFATNIGPGPTTADDETANQQVAFAIDEWSVPFGLMSQPPQLTPAGQLTFFPIADAVGTATYTVTLTDDHPTDAQSTIKTFTIVLQPLNDQPALNPLTVPTSVVTNPTDNEDSYSVASDGTITYTLREENTQAVGVTEPFFIPLVTDRGAVGGLGLAGDSLTDEYINEPYGQYALNWISLVGQFRGDELPLGEFLPPTSSPPSSFDAPWADLRRAGFEYNWALAGADSFTLLDPIPRPPVLPNPIGQHVSLAQDILEGDVTHAVLAIGQNDFSRFSDAAQGIYYGTWDAAQIAAHSDQVLANIEEALTTINVGDVKLVMSNIIDYDLSPAYRGSLPDPVRRAVISGHIEALNDRIEQLAFDNGVPIIDSSRFAKDLLGPDSFTFGGIEISRNPGPAPTNAFVHDGIHPHTISSSIIANSFMNAVNVFYGGNLTLFTEQEILGIVGLDYVADTLNFDYSDYLILPGQAVTGSYDRIGLLDIFTVGPRNESDGTPGGSQSLSLINPTIAITTQQGGTVTPVAGGWNYVPPADFNFSIGGVDSFTYEVSDNGTSYDPVTGTLFADPQTRMNRVEFVLARGQ